jgi:hypothetical protein
MAASKWAVALRESNPLGTAACWLIGVTCGSLALYSFAERRRARALKDKINRRNNKVIGGWHPPDKEETTSTI